MSNLHSRITELVIGTPLEWPARGAWRAVHRRIPDRWLSSTERRGRDYDRATVEIARRTLRTDSHSIDAGAHLGEILTEFVALAPDGRHIAVEPLPDFAQRLRRRFPAVEVSDSALGGEPGRARFVVSSDAARSHLEGVDGAEHDNSEYVEVPVTTLDSLVPPDRNIALIKIDVEGAERDVLVGATSVLSRCGPVIVFECASRRLPAIIDCLEDVPGQRYRVSLLRDHLDGVTPPPPEDVVARAQRDGEYYFVATSSRPES